MSFQTNAVEAIILNGLLTQEGTIEELDTAITQQINQVQETTTYPWDIISSELKAKEPLK